MAYQAKDGKKFTNKPPMQMHERSMARKSEAGGAGTATMEHADPLAQPGDGSGGEMGQDDPQQIAQEHGPAQEVHMMHDHEGGQHHVMSMHPDGHRHESVHGSVDEAHEHGKKLAGGGMESGMGNQDEQGEEPQYE
jgi:hypothetical protein